MRSLLLAAVLLISAQSDEVMVDVGTKSVRLPAPDGFVLLTKEMVALHTKSFSSVPTGNKPLAFFIPANRVPMAIQGEAPQLARWLSVQVKESSTSQSASSSDIDALARIFERRAAALAEEARRRVNSQLAERARSGQIQRPDQAQVGQMEIGKPFLRTPTALGLIAELNNHFQATNEYQDLASAIVFLVVNERLLFLYVSDASGDMSWVTQTARVWVQEIERRNGTSVRR